MITEEPFLQARYYPRARCRVPLLTCSLTGVVNQCERSSWQADVTKREQGGGGLERVLRRQDGQCWAVRCVIDG